MHLDTLRHSHAKCQRFNATLLKLIKKATDLSAQKNGFSVIDMIWCHTIQGVIVLLVSYRLRAVPFSLQFEITQRPITP